MAVCRDKMATVERQGEDKEEGRPGRVRGGCWRPATTVLSNNNQYLFVSVASARHGDEF